MLNHTPVKKYLSYNQLFNKNSDFNENDVINYIKKNNAKELLIGLSALLRISNQELNKLKPDFIKFLNLSHTKFSYSAISDSMLASSQTLMVTMKWIIVHGDFNNVDNINTYTDTNDLIGNCILLTSMVADSLGTHIQYTKDFQTFSELIAPEMQRNAYVNSINNNNINAALIRISLYFNKIINDDSLKQAPDFTNCTSDFTNHYGYSIEQYVASILSFSISINRPFSICKNFFDLFYNQMDEKDFKKEVIEKVINRLTIDISKAKELLSKNYKADWEIDFFWKYGFLKLSSKQLIPLNLSTIVHNIPLSLKFELQKIYSDRSQQRKYFLSFYGKIQEKYIVYILKETTNFLSYVTVIPEFNYKRNSNKSPDALLTVGKRTLLVFESKGFSLTKNSLFSNDDAKYMTDEKKMAIEPLTQIIKRLDELAIYTDNPTTTAPIKINQFNKIYIFSLTAEGIPFNPYGQETINMPIQKAISNSRLHNKIKGYFHLSIEHFEMLVSWLFANESKQNINTKLDNFFKSKSSLNDFIYEKNIQINLLPIFIRNKNITSKTMNTILQENSFIKI